MVHMPWYICHDEEEVSTEAPPLTPFFLPALVVVSASLDFDSPDGQVDRRDRVLKHLV